MRILKKQVLCGFRKINPGSAVLRIRGEDLRSAVQVETLPRPPPACDPRRWGCTSPGAVKNLARAPQERRLDRSPRPPPACRHRDSDALALTHPAPKIFNCLPGNVRLLARLPSGANASPQRSRSRGRLCLLLRA